MEYSKKHIDSRGKELAFLLRHDTGYKFSPDGWREVSDLVENHGYTLDELETIVRKDSKGRYEFSFDRRCIRARQGHSVEVDVNLEERTPPDTLYHGTATRFLDSIMEKGILPMGRLYVHLSADAETARKVGERHGKPAVLEVGSGRMHAAGAKFFVSANGVWLVKSVGTVYIKVVEDQNV